MSSEEVCVSIPRRKYENITVVVDNVSQKVQTDGSLAKIRNCLGLGKEHGEKHYKYLLRNVNLIFEPGEFFGIVGPSGGGKTSLLNVICQRHNERTISSGTMLYNGEKRTKKWVRSRIKYVMSHDKLLGFLKVYEALSQQADMHLPNLSPKARIEEVDKIVKAFDLQSCKNQYIGNGWRRGISSGELKRLSIALQFISSPSVLVLDEPTTGLDSSVGEKIMNLLKNESVARGITVIGSFHQPSAQMIKSFDKIILFNNCSVSYFGSVDSVLNYWNRIGLYMKKDWNIGDFLIESVADENRCGEIIDFWFNSEENKKVIQRIELHKEREIKQENEPRPDCAEISATESHLLLRNTNEEESGWYNFMVLFLKETFVLWKRHSLNTFRNPIILTTILLVHIMQGIILGAIFKSRENPSPDDGFLKLVPDNFWENNYVKAYMYGFDGNGSRPWLDVFTQGVDGNGSFVIGNSNSTLDGVMNSVKYVLDDLSTCLYRKDILPPNMYPPMYDIIFENSSESWRNWTARRVYSNLIALSQIIDYRTGEAPLKKGMNPDFLSKCKEKEGNWMLFGLCLSEETEEWMRNIYDCVGLPRALTSESEFAPVGSPDRSEEDEIAENKLKEIFREIEKNKKAWDQEVKKKYKDYTIEISRNIKENMMGEIVPSAFNDDTKALILLEKVLDSGFDKDMKLLKSRTVQLISRLTGCENQICQFFRGILNWNKNLLITFGRAFESIINLGGCLFFVATILGFSSYTAVLAFPSERTLFNRETANGEYRELSYFLARTLAEIPFKIFPLFIMSTIFYFMAGFDATFHQYMTYLLICILTIFCAEAFGFMISAGSPNLEIAIVVAPLSLVMCNLTSGFYIRDNMLPAWVEPFKYPNFIRWAFLAFVYNQFPANGRYGVLPNNLIWIICGVKGYSISTCLWILFGLQMGFTAASYFLLTYTNRQKGLDSVHS